MHKLSPLLMVLATLAHARAGIAQEDSAIRRAKAHYQQGLSLVDDGNYEGALREFAAAYTASPNFSVLYNIGQAQIALGRPLDASETLSQYLRDGDDKIPSDRRQQVEVQVRLLDSLLAELEVVVDIAGASVSIDGREAGRTPLLKSFRLQPGIHKVLVASQDGSTVARTVRLAQGEHQVLKVELPSPPATSPETPAPHPSPSLPAALDALATSHPSSAVPSPAGSRPPEAGLQGHSRLRRALPYTFIGTGVALGGAALGVYLWNRGRYRDWQSTNAVLTNETQGSAAYRQSAIANNALAASLTSANRTTAGLAIAGAAFLVAGGTVFVVDHRRAKPASAFTLVWTGDRAANLEWRYLW